ncbi:MAG: hypothetical protein QM784_12780 [Polyangiaceae bacterium]
MRNSRWLPLALGMLLSGCHWFSGVRLENVATASGKPSNVAALVSVTKKGDPVRELDLTAFKVIEDGKTLADEQADIRLLDPATVASFHTVLLLDLGHATSEERKRQLAKAAASFVRKVRRTQPVSVLVFDGSSRTRLVGDFSAEPNGSGPEQLDNLLMMVPTDPSRNLRGAVLTGLETLENDLNRTTRPIRRGTLVVFSRGPDIAGRVSSTEFEERTKDNEHQLVYIDVAGDGADEATTRLGEHHAVRSQGPENLPIAFEEAGAIAARLTEQYYLISYCSPARAGQRTLRIEVTVPSTDNEIETDGFETTFDATGFTPGCNSGTPPRFVMTKRDLAKSPNGTTKTETTVSPPTVPSDPQPTEPSQEESEVPPPNKPGYAP